MKIFTILCLCILSAAVDSAQDVWRSVPMTPPGPNDYLVGVAVDGVAVRGQKESKAQVVISGNRESGISQIGIWIDGLLQMISEKELEPYTGPDLGHEALNSHMIEIRLVSAKSEVHFNSRMVMTGGRGFPKGLAADGDLVFNSNRKMDGQFKAFLRQMSEGFNYGVITIGHGVFSPPVEVKFGGKGVEKQLKALIDTIGFQAVR
jgi:hypothetical protein